MLEVNAKSHEDFIERFSAFFATCILSHSSDRPLNYPRYVDFVYGLRKHGQGHWYSEMS